MATSAAKNPAVVTISRVRASMARSLAKTSQRRARPGDARGGRPASAARGGQRELADGSLMTIVTR